MLRFAIIGAGMAGILAAIKLTEAGFDDFTVYEKADTLGGTWRENTYPGSSCDVPSHLYSYSFSLTPEWSHRFSPGRRDPRVLREGRARSRRRPAHPLRRGGRRAAPSRAGSGSSRPRTGARRGRRRHRGDGRAAPPTAPGHRRARSLRGRAVPQLALGPRRRRSTARVSASSARARPPSRSSARSSTVSRGSRCSSAPRSGSCRRRTRPTPTRRSTGSASDPEQLAALHDQLSRDVRRVRRTRSSTRSRRASR